MIRECGCGVQGFKCELIQIIHKRTLSPTDSKAMAMRVGIRFGVCNNLGGMFARHAPGTLLFFFWLTPEVQRVLKNVLGKVGVSSI